MNWGAITSVFLLSAIKFMFAPWTGCFLRLPFFETYFSAVAGAIVSATFFYFLSEWMIRYSHKRKLEKINRLKESGKTIKQKSTKSLRFVIRLKHKLGIVGVAFLLPFFLSVPIGSIITARIYGKNKLTFPLIILGLFVTALITTSISYLIYPL
jgi:hypothetical protein